MKHTRTRLAAQLGLGLIFVGLGHYHVANTREQYPLDGLVYYAVGALCFFFAWRTAQREQNAVWGALLELWREAVRVTRELWREALGGTRQALPFISMRALVAAVLALNIVAARTQSERFHRFFAFFFLIYLLAFIGINLRMLT